MQWRDNADRQRRANNRTTCLHATYVAYLLNSVAAFQRTLGGDGLPNILCLSYDNARIRIDFVSIAHLYQRLWVVLKIASVIKNFPSHLRKKILRLHIWAGICLETNSWNVLRMSFCMCYGPIVVWNKRDLIFDM